MLTVNIVCIGKLKERYFKDACFEYIKRIQGFAKLNIVELPEYKISASPDNFQISAAVEKEGESILNYISCSGGYNIALCIEGDSFSSKKLSDKISMLTLKGFSKLNFIIGGSFGLSESVKQKSDLKLSMSEMTFPHQLARIMLLEQIYRVFQILNNGKYHK